MRSCAVGEVAVPRRSFPWRPDLRSRVCLINESKPCVAFVAIRWLRARKSSCNRRRGVGFWARLINYFARTAESYQCATYPNRRLQATASFASCAGLLRDRLDYKVESEHQERPAKPQQPLHSFQVTDSYSTARKYGTQEPQVIASCPGRS